MTMKKDNSYLDIYVKILFQESFYLITITPYSKPESVFSGP